MTKHPSRAHAPAVLRRAATCGPRRSLLRGDRDQRERAHQSASVSQYLDGASDISLLLRRLDRLGRALERIHQDLELLCESFAVFVRLWFAHTPNIPEDGRRAARASAESRYKQFVEHVSEQYSGGRRVPRRLAARAPRRRGRARRCGPEDCGLERPCTCRCRSCGRPSVRRKAQSRPRRGGSYPGQSRSWSGACQPVSRCVE